MIVERHNDEILVRFSAGKNIGRIQTILDYIRYDELTANSNATQPDLDLLIQEVKKSRFERIKKEIGDYDTEIVDSIIL